MNRWKLGCIILLTVAFALMLSISLSYSLPIAFDIYFHLAISRIWLSGQNGMFSNLVLHVNQFPYPPLFHFLLIPSILLNVPYEFVRALQSVFYPLGLATSMYFMKKTHSWEHAFLVGVTLVSSIGFFDRVMQVNPQALDMILFPIALTFFVSNKKPHFILTSCLMIYNHGIVALSLLGGLFLMDLFSNKRKSVLAILTICLPIIISTVMFLPGGVNMWKGTTDTLQEIQFFQNPFMFLAWYLGPCIIGLFFIISDALKRKVATIEDKAVTWSLLSFAVMAPFWIDRFLCYVPILFAIKIALKLPEEKNRTVKFYAYCFMFCAALSGMLFYWIALFTRGYYVPNPIPNYGN